MVVAEHATGGEVIFDGLREELHILGFLDLEGLVEKPVRLPSV